MQEKYLMYLRKSRQDREEELQTGSYDTLQRHRTALLELAKQQQLHIEQILEEVVSGDTIVARPQMQELLRLVETGDYAGVLVMEIARLARGKTRDQGIVAETFSYSGTKIITPGRTYDPANELDEDFFEFSLFMSRQEYKMINKRLNRGRMASLSEGKYIAGSAPYGYEKYKLPRQKGYSLRPHPDTAEIVRRIFDLYTVGEPNADGLLQPFGSLKIARKLNEDGILSPGGKLWAACTVRDILSNPVYKGDVRWAFRPNAKRMENGVLKVSTPVNPDAIIKKGLHEPLVTEEVWNQAQAFRIEHAHSVVPENKEVKNPLTGLIYCSRCGHSMTRLPKSKRNKYDRFLCMTIGCETVSHRADKTEEAVLQALELWLDSYKLQSQPPTLPANLVKKATDDVKRKQATMKKLNEQRMRLYDLLEQGIYTSEIFKERSQALSEKETQAKIDLERAEEALSAAEEMSALWKNVVPAVELVLKTYKEQASAIEKNKLLKAAVSKIIFEKTTTRTDPILYVYPRIQVEI